jgi:hypothetical protein
MLPMMAGDGSAMGRDWRLIGESCFQPERKEQ